ncbi:M20/M25/M40 family metallo-hydrolase [Lysobacter koreensis]|uniref:M20/M25/M40 family metallo-hydrolase n=1 Tax=Lysobacter koreensis TaxID=266122 RepID=A0ABW2YPC1_9GAMM
MKRAAIALLVLLTASCKGDRQDLSAAAPDAASAAATRIEADVRFLADDLLEGREAGTRGHELAALYVAQRLRAIGLSPAGDGGSYYQRVPLLRATRVADGGRLVITRHGASTALTFREQFLPALNYNGGDMAVEAPAVFVGQGVHAPELRHDDFRGVDLRGRIAVLFAGAPASFDPDRRAFHSSTREKLRELSARGAVGAVFVDTDADEARSPWSRAMQAWDKPGMCLRREASPLAGRAADGGGIDTFPQLRVVAHVSAAAADAVLAGDGRSAAQLFRAAKDGTLKPFALPGTIALAARTAIVPVTSRNVVARLPGSDRALASEHVLFSAHLDHVGIGAPVDGDRIYNGALDNALGVAVMLEAARQLAALPRQPKRSLLFVALTAEEKGLLGAEWYARHPTVARGSLVANVNMDMPMLLVPTDDIVPVGLSHSTLEPLVRRAAKEVGVALSPDPFPEQTIFVRSDQYAFIRAGIPAVYLTAGTDATHARDDASLAMQVFLRDHYHQPSDDVTQPIQYPDAARLARLNARIGALIGDAAQRPAWHRGDFFGERFGRTATPAPTSAQ